MLPRRVVAAAPAFLYDTRLRRAMQRASASSVFRYDTRTGVGVPLAIGMTPAEVEAALGRPVRLQDYGVSKIYRRGSVDGIGVSLEFTRAKTGGVDRLTCVALDGSDAEQLIVDGRDLAHMPLYQACEWLFSLDPNAEIDSGVTSCGSG